MRRVPDILLERFLSGDLKPEERRLIEERRASNDEVRRRLEELTRERQSFLAAYPPQQFAHKVAVRLAREQQAPAVKRRLWGFVLAPSFAAAATVLLAIGYSRLAEKEQVFEQPRLEQVAAESKKAPASMPPPAAEPLDELRAAAPVEPSVDAGQRRPTPPSTRFAGEPPTARRAGRARERGSISEAVGDAAPAEKKKDEVRFAQPPPGGATGSAGKGGVPFLFGPAETAAESAAPAPAAAAPPTTPPAPSTSAAADDEAPQSAAGALQEKAKSEARDVAPKKSAPPASPPPQASAPVSPERPAPETVESVVESLRPSLRSCFDAARRDGKLASGSYVLDLTWTITAEGSVNDVVAKGAEVVRKSSVPRCVRAKVRAWRFPPSQLGSPASFRLRFEVP